MVKYAVSLDKGKTWIDNTKVVDSDQGQVWLGKSINAGKSWQVYRKFAPDTTTVPPLPEKPSIGKIAFVNASSESDTNVKKWMNACKKQADLHISAYWAYTCEVEFIAKGKTIPKSDIYCAILNNSTEAGVLGWHDYTDGKPTIKIFAAESRKFGENPSVTISHEVAESIGDLTCDTTVTGLDESGKPCLYFMENCDPVEAGTYDIDGVTVSNFVTQLWFSKSAPANSKFDYLGKCKKQFEILDGGYMLVSYDGGKNWSEIDKFNKKASQHKSEDSRWAIYKKRFENQPLTVSDIDIGTAKAGGILFTEGKLSSSK